MLRKTGELAKINIVTQDDLEKKEEQQQDEKKD